jgi:tRNA nucleotidyltransferase (CCA-adding enzyme)
MERQEELSPMSSEQLPKTKPFVHIQPAEEAAFVVLRRLQPAGFEAYLIGGCVRDILLSRPVKDFDIVTSALPDQVGSNL